MILQPISIMVSSICIIYLQVIEMNKDNVPASQGGSLYGNASLNNSHLVKRPEKRVCMGDNYSQVLLFDHSI